MIFISFVDSDFSELYSIVLYLPIHHVIVGNKLNCFISLHIEGQIKQFSLAVVTMCCAGTNGCFWYREIHSLLVLGSFRKVSEVLCEIEASFT